jgi:hypothetical protein
VVSLVRHLWDQRRAPDQERREGSEGSSSQPIRDARVKERSAPEDSDGSNGEDGRIILQQRRIPQDDPAVQEKVTNGIRI